LTTQAREIEEETAGPAARDWRSRAACMEIAAPNTVFFPIAEEPDIEDVAEAKAVCAGCAVACECLVYAIETGQSHGIWGGLTPTERDEFVVRERGLARR